jgi:hypothetical protein
MAYEIGKLKEFIDDLGRKYIARQADALTKPFNWRESEVNYERMDNPKKWYLKQVQELKEKFGVLYDPLRLTGT